MEIIKLLIGWIATSFEDEDPNGRAELDPDG